MKIRISKVRTAKALIFSFLGLLAFCIISTINSGATYATTSSAVISQNLVEKVALGNNAVEFLPAYRTEFHKIVETRDGYIMVGREADKLGERHFAPAAIKYVDSDNDGNYEVQWHKVLTDTSGEYFDALYYEDTYYGNVDKTILVVGQINDKAIVQVLDNSNGDLLDTYTSDTESVYKFIGNVGDSNNHDQFDVADDLKVYGFVDKEGTTYNEIRKTSDGTSYDDQTILMMRNSVHDIITITTGSASRSAISGIGSFTVYGDFIAGAVTDGSFAVITSDNKVQQYSIYDGGTVRYETALPADFTPTDITMTNFGISRAVYVRGYSRKSCDLGGFSNNEDVMYKILDGDIVYAKSLLSGSRAKNDILAVSDTQVIVSSTVFQGIIERVNARTVWYTDGDNPDVTYEFKSSDNPNITKCDSNNNDSNTAVTSVAAGNIFDPKEPSATGFTFDGWYTDPALSDKIAPTGTIVVNEDTTLYGKWSRNTYNVTFSWGGAHPDASLPADQHPAYEGYVTRPANPGTYSGYTFNGWFDYCGGHQFDFNNTQITKNTTIYGCWSQDQNTVTFRSVSSDHPESYTPSTAFYSKTVNYGETITLPNPRASGNNSRNYTFNGWYLDEGLTRFYGTPGQTSDAITTGLTLYGEWIDHTIRIEEGDDGLELVNPDNLTSITFDKESNVLTLDGLQSDYPIKIDTDEEVTVVLKNENLISGDFSSALTSEGPLTIIGDGSLTTIFVMSNQDLNIEDTTVTALYISAQGDTNIKDSDVTVAAIEAYGDVNIDNSNLNELAEDSYPAIATTGDLNITNNSTVKSEKIEVLNDGNINIKDSEVVINKHMTTNNGDINIENSDITVMEEGIGTDSEHDINIKNSNVATNGTLATTGGDINVTDGSAVTVDGMMMAEDILVKDSKLDLSTEEPLTVNNITVENGELNVNFDIDDEGNALRVNEVFKLDGGSVNLNNDAGGNYFISALIIEDGNFTAEADVITNQIVDNYITEINGGSLTIKGSTDGDNLGCGLSTAFAIFNGGVTNITTVVDDEYAPNLAVCVDLDGMSGESKRDAMPNIISGAKEILGIDLVEGNYIQFNGGDNTLKGGLSSAGVLSFEEDVKDTISVAENMVQDPEGTTIDKAGLQIDTNLYLYINTFSNGGVMEVDPDLGIITNTARYVHIYPYVEPYVPPVPNTVDYEIVIVAIAILVAVLFQGAIIADLYRRIHGYEEEITTVESGNTMMDNQPVSEQPAQDQPEESPAETVEVKFNNTQPKEQDDSHDIGDEYYY